MAVLRGTWATVAVLMALVSAGSCAAEDEFQSIKGRVKLPKTARPPTMRVVLNAARLKRTLDIHSGRRKF